MLENVKNESQTRVVMCTAHFRIYGDLALMAGTRLTDYMNNGETFLAVTNAIVTNHSGDDVLKSSFINLNRRHIEFIVEEDTVR